MDSYYNYLSQTDKKTVSSLMKKTLPELGSLKLEAQRQEMLYLSKKYTPENNNKVKYYSNRASLIDYVIKKKRR